MTVTGLANLGHFKKHISYVKSCAHGKRFEVKALYNEIFPKCSEFHICAPVPEFLYFFI